MAETTENNLSELSGTVEKITYRNDVNCYTVAEIRAGKERVTVVGTLPYLSEGDAAVFFRYLYGTPDIRQSVQSGKL